MAIGKAAPFGSAKKALAVSNKLKQVNPVKVSAKRKPKGTTFKPRSFTKTGGGTLGFIKKGKMIK